MRDVFIAIILTLSPDGLEEFKVMKGSHPAMAPCERRITAERAKRKPGEAYPKFTCVSRQDFNASRDGRFR